MIITVNAQGLLIQEGEQVYLLFCLLFYDLGTFSRQAYSAISISRMCLATQRPRRSSSLIEFRKWHVPVWNVLGGEGVCQELRHLQEEDVGFHSRVHVIHSGDSTLVGKPPLVHHSCQYIAGRVTTSEDFCPLFDYFGFLLPNKVVFGARYGYTRYIENLFFESRQESMPLAE